MFLRRLSKMERQAFLALAREYILADEKLAPAEIEALRVLCAEMEFDANMHLPQKPRQEWLAEFGTRQSRVVALLELLGLAQADGNFEARERELVFETATAFGVSEAELKALADWRDRLQQLLEDAAALMREPEYIPPPLPRRKRRPRKSAQAKTRAPERVKAKTRRQRRRTR
jgi:hypothetical protein